MKDLSKNWYKWLPTFMLVVVLSIMLPLSILLAEGAKDPDEAFGKYNDIKDQIKKQESLLKQKQKEKRSVLGELTDIDKDILYLNGRIESFEHDLRVKKAQMSELERQLGHAADDMASARAKFEERLVAWYKSGSQQDIEFILSAKDLGDFITRIYYTQKILEEDQVIIKEIVTQKGALFSARDELDAEIDEVKGLKEDLSGYRADYQRLWGSKKNVFDDIAGDEQAIEDAIGEMEQESQDIATFLRGIDHEGFRPIAGNFDGTFSRPVEGRITSGFGNRVHPILKRRKMHTGIDIGASSGTPIRAAGGGQIVFSGWKSGYGKTIIIDHGNGLATLYGHCSQLLVSDGEYVMEGQVIAKVGSTGFSTGPHLHFEVRKNGEPKDPTAYLH